MSIFNNGYTGYYGDTSDVEGTIESGFKIAHECYRDVLQLNAGLYVSDILIETSLTEGASYDEVEALTEGAFGDFIAKIKKKFEELIKKIKAWFKKIFDNISILFTSYDKFYSKYKKRFENLPEFDSDKTVEVYDIDKVNKLTDVEAELAINKVDGAVTDLYNKHILNKGRIGEIGSTNKKGDDIYDVKMTSEKSQIGDTDYLYKAGAPSGAGTVTSMTELEEAFEHQFVELSEVDLDKVDYKKFINFLSKSNKNVKKSLEDKTKSVIKTCEDVKNKLDKFKDDKGVASEISKHYGAAVNIMQKINTKTLDIHLKAYKKTVEVLKQVLYAANKGKKKSTKESATSLFESAMELI